ncbi:Hypothetical Protein FCC1311_005252 [Hondaea fermentalgiana]|uniref:Uncharacterized protein n=1 Tax=Hondaea fermentalgiana TaxID=2315210 RepID=A0A2R5FZW1_9STRA|nr:Hypothetical Protein FCC1311_005252 [Hondaea fermentalgiana]|eukprot:GBG24307.1 Hypothetical Protein FCC1311_005252 [Hondaea fermentalgiana]
MAVEPAGLGLENPVLASASTPTPAPSSPPSRVLTPLSSSAQYDEDTGPRTFYVEEGVSVLSLTSNRRIDATAFLSGVFRTIVEHGIQADMVASSVSDVALAFKHRTQQSNLEPDLTERIAALCKALEPIGVQSSYTQGHALIECETRGSNENGPCEFQSEIYRVFASHGILSHLFVSQASQRDPSQAALVSIVVPEKDVECAVQQMIRTELFVPA